MKTFLQGFFLTGSVSSIRMVSDLVRRQWKVGLVGSVIFLLLFLPSIEAEAAREDFENSMKPKGPEFLDKSTMDILVGAKGTQSGETQSEETQSKESPEIKPSEPQAADGSLAREMAPDIGDSSLNGYDETIDWTDFESSSEEKNLPDTAIEGLLEESIPSENPEIPKAGSSIEDVEKIQQGKGLPQESSNQ